MDYLEILKERRKISKIYSKHQATGLLLAKTLADDDHKSLYIKLAKEYDDDRLLDLAKEVARRKNVENKGAYFMRLLTKTAIRKKKKGK